MRRETGILIFQICPVLEEFGTKIFLNSVCEVEVCHCLPDPGLLPAEREKMCAVVEVCSSYRTSTSKVFFDKISISNKRL
jgi:hypothetical protein